MKFLSALAILLLSSTGFCQQTTIDIIPDLAADCLHTNYPLLNQVGNVKKVAEDGDSVTFSFDTVYGACQNQVVSPVDMSTQASVSILRNKIVLFQKDPVQSSLVLTKSSQARITMTFDKNRIFKNSDEASFSMNFYPAGPPVPHIYGYANGQTYYYYTNYLYFPWEIVLTQVDDDNCALSIKVGQSQTAIKK